MKEEENDRRTEERERRNYVKVYGDEWYCNREIRWGNSWTDASGVHLC